MRQIVLHKLRLSNFKGLAAFTLQPHGHSIDIYGRNATGKTTLMDAFTWCLFGKDSLGQAAFEIKGVDADGQSASGLDHEVEVVLGAGDETITFRKTLREKWTKKRGEAERTFTGHEINHFVDEVPVQKRQFDDAVSRVADEQLFRLLTNPRHFNEGMHWEKRRALLLEVCGDVSDVDVIERNPELEPLTLFLGKRKLEDHIKVLKGRRVEINREISEIPIRIDEAEKAKVHTENQDPKSINATLVQLRGQRADLEAQIVRIQTGGEIAEKTKALRDLEAKLQAHDHAAIEDAEKVRSEKRKILADLIERLREVEAENRRQEREQSEMAGRIAAMDAKLETLRAKWNERNAETFSATVRCPTCGQSMPDEMIQDARSNWNRRKAEDLAAIQADGKRIAAERASLAGVQFVMADTQTIKDQIASADAALGAHEVKPDPERDQFVAGIEILKSAISELSAGTSDEVTEIRVKVGDITGKIEAQEKALAAIDGNATMERRIADLKASERKLAAELVETEKQLFLCEAFVKAKVGMLEHTINSRFKLARFKLFSQNINGGIEPCCETVVGGVPYGSLNNAARINVGIDISNTLSEHYGIALPVFIDNAEAVCVVLPSAGQQIRMYVSAQHEQLTIGG